MTFLRKYSLMCSEGIYWLYIKRSTPKWNTRKC